MLYLCYWISHKNEIVLDKNKKKISIFYNINDECIEKSLIVTDEDINFFENWIKNIKICENNEFKKNISELNYIF